MENQIYQQTEITKKFKKSSFPKNKISNDINNFYDIIFNRDYYQPAKQHTQNQEELNKYDYFKHLIFDEKYKKASITNKEQYKIWNMDVTNVGYGQELKQKNTNIEFQNFKKNFNLVSNTSVNVMIFNNKLVSQENVSVSNKKKESKKEETRSITSEEFFKNNFDDDNFKFKKSNVYSKDSLVDCVYKVNEKINYPRDLPLWYVFHQEAESAYGPLTSEEIEEMIKTNLLDEKSQIRLIDVFQYKGCKQFDYFDVKEVQLENFSDSIKVSSLAFNFKLSINNLKSSNSQDKKVQGNHSNDRDFTNKSKFNLILINL